ncbi:MULTISPECIES: fimbrial protein [Citrobacter]|uniref:fimbrial protein n=1 Tax=Citrobacter TaxID=544 RepID=UPI0011229FCB|nr:MULTISPECIES: fimbrial protein [Citrobacter]EKX2182922.1 fimbrial protein [Citrobacter freundii]MBA7995457.1 fimbrial protein [Citrobacter freundii]MBJ8966520.1 fimbrial protein [Citrobacter freundii]MDV1634875.1 fimbrial protein [Citrobacter freundii]MDV1714610.1 fimbrial protein [Citrobacter freundii]
MLKKNGIITLLLLGLCGVSRALASCSFTTPATTYIDQTMASSPVTAVTLTSTNLQQLFQSSVLVGGPVISTCNPSTGTAISVSGDGFSSGSLPETMPDGGLLIGGIADGFGYGFWYTVTYGDGSGSVSGHLKKGGMFTATPEQLNGARWEFRAELWYVGGLYSDKSKSKSSQISAVNTTYFKLGFNGVMKGFYFHSPVIPITPTTCNVTIDTSKVDFGTFDFFSNMPINQYVTLKNNGCSMVSDTELRVLSNGNPIDTNNNLLLNKLTGDNAASGFGVNIYNKVSREQYILNAPLAGGDLGTGTGSYEASNGFLLWQEIPIVVRLLQDGKTLKDGDFEATATFNMSYY